MHPLKQYIWPPSTKYEVLWYELFCLRLLRILFVVNLFSSGHPKRIQTHTPFAIDPDQKSSDKGLKQFPETNVAIAWIELTYCKGYMLPCRRWTRTENFRLTAFKNIVYHMSPQADAERSGFLLSVHNVKVEYNGNRTA